MPIGNDSFLDNSGEVLRAFLVSSKKVYRRKNKQSGYGLIKADFAKTQQISFNVNEPKLHNATPKMFYYRKADLLKNHYITELQSNERGKHYGITPLGIIFYVTQIKKIDLKTFDKIMSIMKFFYESGRPANEISYLEEYKESWGKLRKVIKEEKLLEIFKSIFSGIDNEIESNNQITLSYESSYGLKTPIIDYMVLDNEYRIFNNSEMKELNQEYWITNKVEFYYNITKFLLQAFAYSIFETIEWEERNTSTKNKKMGKIPIEIHGIALEFSELLNESLNKLQRFDNITHHNLKETFTQKNILTIHEIKERKEKDTLYKQWDNYIELVEKIHKEKIRVYSKAKLKGLMLKTNAWKNKGELEQFWSKNLKDIRKSFGEEIGFDDRYERVFARELKEIKRQNQLYEIKD